MPKRMFLIKGNICGERIKIARVLHQPSLSQEQLAHKIQLMGLDMTTMMISRIEKGERHVCDAELLAVSKALHVTMEWLCGEGDIKL